jgi:hypothetical protein
MVEASRRARASSLAAVNDAPVLTGIQTTLAAGTGDTAYTVSAANLLAGFTDVDGDTVSISGLSAKPRHSPPSTATGPSPSRLRPTTTAPSVLGYTVIDGQWRKCRCKPDVQPRRNQRRAVRYRSEGKQRDCDGYNAKGATVGTLVASDPDSTAFSFSIVSDITASFAISEAHSISRAARI